jgi:hypothetical protein
VARPALVQANLDLDGRLMRAQVARATIREAVDEVHDRLRDRVQRAEGRWEAARHGPDAGRYDGRGVTLPQRSDRTGRRRPTGDDLIVRRKSVRPPRLLVDEAAAVMEMLDYPFFFFVETGSGVDSLLRADPASPAVRLLQIDPAPRSVVRGLVPVVVSATPAPRMSVGDAASRLDATGDPFLFFRDSASARGAVVYRRFDGRLGLLEPPES